MNRTATPPIGNDPAQALNTGAFDYDLDPQFIAQRPLPERDASRLLVIRRIDGSLQDHVFTDIVELIASGDVLVLNDTRVIPARLLGQKPTGAAAEVLLIRPIDPSAERWHALVRPGGKLKPGRIVKVADELSVQIEDSTEDGGRIVRLLSDLLPAAALARFGHTPLPPYIDREDDELDRRRYQTVYAREDGSVAAPTAGLHFTENILEMIRARGVGIAQVTLHVGPATFRLVEEEDPARHRMGSEWYRITPEAATMINGARDDAGSVWAVGTTTVRTLEAAAGGDGRVAAGEGSTELFIRPSYDFRVVDRLVTNFHLPRSTLLMLVAAFAGYGLTMTAYRHAMAQQYRFLSYGDATLII